MRNKTRIFASADPERNFRTAIVLLVTALVQFEFIFASVFDTILRPLEVAYQIGFAFCLSYGIGLILWSRIQEKREKKEEKKSKVTMAVGLLS